MQQYRRHIYKRYLMQNRKENYTRYLLNQSTIHHIYGHNRDDTWNQEHKHGHTLHETTGQANYTTARTTEQNTKTQTTDRHNNEN